MGANNKSFSKSKLGVKLFCARVLLVDDLLATGGTIGTSIILLGLANAKVVGCGFIIELSELNGRSHIKDIPVKSLITYDDA